MKLPKFLHHIDDICINFVVNIRLIEPNLF